MGPSGLLENVSSEDGILMCSRVAALIERIDLGQPAIGCEFSLV